MTKRGEMYRWLYDQGKSTAWIADAYGVTRQAVWQAITPVVGRSRARRRHAAKRATRPAREYRCGVCGGLGHNARTCDAARTVEVA